MVDVEAWPAPLRHLVVEYGPGAVWRASLDHPQLGYPPTWLIGGTNIGLISSALQQQQGQGARHG